jgi:hypothetical protein
MCDIPKGQKSLIVTVATYFTPTHLPVQWVLQWVALPAVRRPGRVVDHPPLSSAEVKERVQPYLFSHSGPS